MRKGLIVAVLSAHLAQHAMMGVQNGDEDGVDCGGSFCPACPTCDDGVQNGNEDGVDCGGSFCPPCESDSCPVPTGINVQFFANPTIVQIDWNDMPGAVSYEIRFRLQGTTNWTTLSTVSSSTFLTRLNAGATYEFEIRSICGDSSSAWSSTDTFVSGGNLEEGPDSFDALEIVNLFPNPTRSHVQLIIESNTIGDIDLVVI